MLQVNITMTGKGFAPTAKWGTFGEDRKHFADMAELKKWMKDTYGTCKRAPMYIDKGNNTTIPCGWVFGYKNREWNGGKWEHYIQQDWVSVSRLETVDVSKEK